MINIRSRVIAAAVIAVTAAAAFVSAQQQTFMRLNTIGRWSWRKPSASARLVEKEGECLWDRFRVIVCIVKRERISGVCHRAEQRARIAWWSPHRIRR